MLQLCEDNMKTDVHQYSLYSVEFTINSLLCRQVDGKLRHVLRPKWQRFPKFNYINFHNHNYPFNIPCKKYPKKVHDFRQSVDYNSLRHKCHEPKLTIRCKIFFIPCFLEIIMRSYLHMVSS